MIAGGDIPVLPRGVRTRFDAVRDTDVLLGPERVLMLDQIGVAILSRVTGEASVADISTDLSQTYAAPLDVIQPDVEAFLQDLVDKRFVDLHHG